MINVSYCVEWIIDNGQWGLAEEFEGDGGGGAVGGACDVGA